MSFESPDNEKDFPGLYNAPDQISVTEEDHDKGSKKKDGKKDKKEGKKDKKDKGYIMFEQEDSEDELVVTDDLTMIKSPSKGKKIKPTFRFPKKDIFPKSKEKDEKKEKEGRKSEEKKKEDKEGKKEKHKFKEKKKSKHRDVIGHSTIPAGIPDKPVFGVPLSVAVDRSKCHDGIELPAIFRECIDYIEEHGLTCEGIYRISGVKSKIQQLKDCYNKSLPAYLCEHEPNVVASLLKQFLRELPEPVLTTQLMPKFEEASTVKTEAKRLEAMKKLIQELPICNRLLLSWMIVHMTHIIKHRTRNKMSLQNVSIVLSPTMQISHRVLNVFFSMSNKLFEDTQIKKYVPPLRPATSRWSLELPDNLNLLEEELAKQESLLNALHEELKTGVEDQSKEEQLWEVQRVVTQLKRKIKLGHKSSERKKEMDAKKPKPVSELDELNLDLQPVTEVVVENVPETAQESHTETAVENESQSEKTESAETKSAEGESVEIKAVVSQNDGAEPVPEQNVSKVDEKAEQNVPEEVENEQKPEDLQSREENVTIPVVGAVEKIEADAEKIEIDTEQIETDAERTTQEAPEIEHAEEEVAPEPKIPVPIKTPVSEPHKDVETVAAPKTIETAPKTETTNQIASSNSSSQSEQPEQVPQTQTVKPSGPIQPHLQISQQPLQPIKVSPQKLPSNQKSTDSIDGEQILPPPAVTEEKKAEQPVVDEEMKKLLEDEYAMTLEEEELLAIGDELKQKIETEQSEIERLKQEIVELQYLRQDSDLEDYSSTSESSDESEDEEELTELLNSLIAENEELEKKNSELCQKIHEERMACLDCKVSIRLIQQKQLDSDNILDRDNPI